MLPDFVNMEHMKNPIIAVCSRSQTYFFRRIPCSGIDADNFYQDVYCYNNYDLRNHLSLQELQLDNIALSYVMDFITYACTDDRKQPEIDESLSRIIDTLGQSSYVISFHPILRNIYSDIESICRYKSLSIFLSGCIIHINVHEMQVETQKALKVLESLQI